MELSDKVLKHVWDKIESIEVGEVITVKNEAPNRPEIWVECANKWIDIYNRGEFNSDYSKFKKILTFNEQINTQ